MRVDDVANDLVCYVATLSNTHLRELRLQIPGEGSSFTELVRPEV